MEISFRSMTIVTSCFPCCMPGTGPGPQIVSSHCPHVEDDGCSSQELGWRCESQREGRIKGLTRPNRNYSSEGRRGTSGYF